ncbi:MAG TPA: tripartite tricarboxylate transporter substrate binding protein [Burkholderiaceae bacterium]|nr:tripartite tricarboxylate transporter substrate binding protein [Burkholderiaceae bacterium]
MTRPSLASLTKSLLVAALVVQAAPSSAQGAAAGYPRQTVTITVAYAAGGATDITTRVIAQELAKMWGQSVVVENRPGAGGNIGASMIARAKPDGYNLIMVAPAHTVNATLYPNPGYEPIKDFEPIGQVTNMTNMVVAHPSFPAKDIRELLEMAKKPEAVAYASGGVGTSEHMAAELFQFKTGVKMTHIPYKGTGQVIPDLLSGQVKLTFGNMPALLQHIQKGALKPLAVSTAKRSSALPEVPTVAEAGVPGYEVIVWLGLLAPAGTPADVVQKINADVATVLKLPAVRERFASMGLEPAHSSPAEFRRLLESEIDKYATVIRAAKLRIE